jgi:hypothetical protein
MKNEIHLQLQFYCSIYTFSPVEVHRYSLTFLLFFASFSKMEKVAKNGRKVKSIALLFCCFLPLYEKWKKSLKMAEK